MKEAQTMRARWQRGFTLIEMMITIALVAILATIAVPSFSDLQRRSAISSQTNILVTGLALARSEASKRGQRVSLCSRNGSVCTASSDWSSGWLIFVDTDGDGTMDAGEALLHQSPAQNNGVSVTASANSLTFQPSGDNLNPTTIDISKSGCGTNDMRELSVAASGRVSIAKKDC